MAHKIPDYISWLKEPYVNGDFIGLAIKNYPLTEVRDALALGLKKKAMSIKDTQPDAAQFFYAKAQSLKRGEEVKVFGKKIPMV
ncbi:MAG: hypothetical protein NTY20_02370 [Candidatus Aenigmarchaeota archaeon]|nr:hypothetical protein [Candidatus Aenigmarchaeota archaeon]